MGLSKSKTYVPIYYFPEKNEQYQKNFEKIFGKGKSKGKAIKSKAEQKPREDKESRKVDQDQAKED